MANCLCTILFLLGAKIDFKIWHIYLSTRMNGRKFSAKITKIANFTFQQFSSNCNSSEENNKINNLKNNNSYLEEKANENNKPSSCIDLDKEKKRAPLGEVKINTTGEIYAPSERSLNNPPLFKKRTERFEVRLDHDETAEDVSKNNCEDMNPINSTFDKKRDLSDNENCNELKINGNSRDNYLDLSPLPGKENVMPKKTPTKIVFKEYSSFCTENISSHDAVPELSSPRDCLTSKSLIPIAQLKGQLTINDPLYISYEDDIYKWMLYKEKAHRPKANFMDKQTNINVEMRAILIDWFVDVIVELELSPASFFLAVSLTDRTLSIVDCPRERLQLLGATAILISTKVQEVFPPLVKDIVFVTDDSYSENQVRKMEKVILRVTDFQLYVPLVDSFAQLYDHTSNVSAYPLNQVARHLMWYFLELSTFDCLYVYILPSRLAAAAFLLALSFQSIRQNIEPNVISENAKCSKLWSDEMVERTKIKRSELEEPARMLMKLQQKAVLSKFQALFKKFSCSKRCKVACLKPLEFDDVASQFSDNTFSITK